MKELKKFEAADDGEEEKWANEKGMMKNGGVN